jgi:hypothetical protein
MYNVTGTQNLRSRDHGRRPQKLANMPGNSFRLDRVVVSYNTDLARAALLAGTTGRGTM